MKQDAKRPRPPLPSDGSSSASSTSLRRLLAAFNSFSISS
jgi:hypothetical protein